MKKRFLKLTGILVTTAMLMTACSMPGNTGSEDIEITDANENTVDTESEAQETEETAETSTTENSAPAADSASSAALPAYEYPGPELLYYQVYQYIVNQYASAYTSGDVCIPYVNEIMVESSVRNDIRFYADFWVFNYKLEGDTLVCVSGGAHPGVIHLDDDYNVISMDVVEDGSNYTESAKTIFGEYYDQFSKISADEESRNSIRAQIISNYVASNQLNITKYKDEGHDPITLPEENIESFYSEDL